MQCEVENKQIHVWSLLLSNTIAYLIRYCNLYTFKVIKQLLASGNFFFFETYFIFYLHLLFPSYKIIIKKCVIAFRSTNEARCRVFCKYIRKSKALRELKVTPRRVSSGVGAILSAAFASILSLAQITLRIAKSIARYTYKVK